MSTAEHLQPVSERYGIELPRNRSLEAGALVFLVALTEGIAAATTILACALAYHTVILDVSVHALRLDLYFAFALGLGSIFAAFSAQAAWKFLNGETPSLETATASVLDWTISLAIALLIAFLTGQIGDLSRVSITTAYGAGIVQVVALRRFIRTILARKITAGALRFRKIGIIGNKVDVLKFLLANDLWRHGQQITATLYLDEIAPGPRAREAALSNFAGNAVRQKVDYIVIATDINGLDAIDNMQPQLQRYALNVVYALFAGQRDFHVLDVIQIGPSNTLRVQKRPLDGTSIFIKRCLDVMAAALAIVLLSPLMLLIALLVKYDSPGPAIYRQARRGFNGDPFTIFKFRTMTVMEAGDDMRQARRGDQRITRIGRFLRASSLDELPQLFNVLHGTMSLVGPRPHALSHDDELGRQIEKYANRRRIKPGITGWAQVNGHRGETVSMQQIENRTRFDLYYIEHWSIFLDVWILILTVLSPTTHRNSF